MHTSARGARKLRNCHQIREKPMLANKLELLPQPRKPQWGDKMQRIKEKPMDEGGSEGIWIKIMTKKGLHARFIDDIFEKDILWIAIDEVKGKNLPRPILVKEFAKKP